MVMKPQRAQLAARMKKSTHITRTYQQCESVSEDGLRCTLDKNAIHPKGHLALTGEDAGDWGCVRW